MRPDRQRRILAAAVVSVAVHVALLVALVLHAPRLRVYEQPSGPPQAIIPVLILPRAPPPVAGSGAKPAPIRLHRRAQRFAPQDLPVAPLVAPVEEAPARPAPATGPRTVTGPPAPTPGEVNAQRALRAMVGCANPSLLTRAEREKCEERLAAGARDAPYLGTGVDRDKARSLEAAAARKEADVRYRNAAPTPNAAPGRAGAGASAEELGRQLGNDRPKAVQPI